MGHFAIFSINTEKLSFVLFFFARKRSKHTVLTDKELKLAKKNVQQILTWAFIFTFNRCPESCKVAGPQIPQNTKSRTLQHFIKCLKIQQLFNFNKMSKTFCNYL